MTWRFAMSRLPQLLRATAAAALAVLVSGLVVLTPAAAQGGSCGWNPSVVGLLPGEQAESFRFTFPDPWETTVEVAFNGVFNPAFTESITIGTGTVTFNHADELAVLRQGLGDPSVTSGAVTYRYPEIPDGPRACEISVVLWEGPSPTTSSTVAPTTSTTVPAAEAVTPRYTG
jgi:hypothetical protein